MRIAQVPPLFESIPPKLYGGTERVVSYLTEELVQQGHNVTLFGTKDSVTSANLYPVCDKAMRLNPDCRDTLAWHVYQLEMVMENASEFDIIHFHNDYLHFPLSSRAHYKHITTLHGRLDLEDLLPIYKRFHEMPLVSISNNQRKPLPHVNWIRTVYHGLPGTMYKPGSGDGKYLAFLGRISPEKRPDRAIEIAKATGVPLKIAAKVDKADEEYFETTIKPLLDHPLIEFIGEIGDDRKEEFLGNALALLFPIDWPEPFGIVMIEALATGTPVIAFRHGSVPEIIEDGKTGFVVDNVQQAVKAVDKVSSLERSVCRQVFETSFTSTVMARNYVSLYQEVCGKKGKIFHLPGPPDWSPKEKYASYD